MATVLFAFLGCDPVAGGSVPGAESTAPAATCDSGQGRTVTREDDPAGDGVAEMLQRWTYDADNNWIRWDYDEGANGTVEVRWDYTYDGDGLLHLRRA